MPVTAPQSSEYPPPHAALLALTQDMLVSAEAGEWEQLMALEAKRRPLLTALFEPVADASAVRVVRDIAEVVLKADRRILALSEAGREQTAADLARIDQGQRAVRAYKNP
jgi:hypothetical protein